MATKDINTYPDLLASYVEGGFDKGIGDLVNSFVERSSILSHANLMPCNLGSRHMMSILAGLPEAYFTKYYEGHKPSAAERINITEDTALLKSSSVIDVDFINAVCKTPAEKDELCRREAMYNHGAIVNAITRNIFYGDKKKDSSQFTGLVPRFNELSGGASTDGVFSARGFITPGQASTLTSIWFVTWGDSTTSLIYPGNTMGGITKKDHGIQKIQAKDGKTFMGRETEFTWQGGLAVSDWRYISRICNISRTTRSVYVDRLVYLLRHAYYHHEGRLHSKGMVDNTYIYCNSDVKKTLDSIAINEPIDGGHENFVRLKPGGSLGNYEVTTYRGIPIVECPFISSSESQVT